MRYRPIAAIGALALAFVGCQTTPRQTFVQREQAVDFRQLYEPLAASDPDLLRAMRTLDAESVAFDLTALGARRVPYPLPEELLWSEQRAVFYRVDQAGQSRWLYFNPLKLRVEAVERPLPADGDLVPMGEDGFGVYRSVPVKKGGVETTADLDLFRFDFAIDEEGRIAPAGYERITYVKGADMQPAPFTEVERVVYVHAAEDAPHQLLVADPYAGPARPLFEGQDFDALFPAILPDGRLVFFSDEPGYYALYQLGDAAEYVRALERFRQRAEDSPPPDWRTLVRPFEYPFPQPQLKRDIFIASVPSNGALVPQLLQLPETVDFDTLARLVRAHNPHVNEWRARYAAALVDAARYKLNNWPRLDFGISFEDRVEVFSSMPTLFAGDTLANTAWNFLLGLTQPLLDFKENNALTLAALEDAEIARHRLDAELNERLTEATDLYFEATYLTRQIAIEDAQLDVTERRAKYYRALRSKGESTRLQLMAVDQVRVGIESERDFHAERLGFLHSRLKEVAGMPSDLDLHLANERYALGEYEPPMLEDAIHRALANHPSLLAAKSAVMSAYYEETAGPSIRARANLNAGYEARVRDFELGTTTGNVDQDRTDELVTLALSGQVPLASWRAKRIHGQFWTNMQNALQLAQDAEARRVRTAVEEAYLDFRAAQRDLGAKEATRAFYLEKWRVARLHQEYGPPGGPLTVLRPPDEPGAIEETLASGVLAPLTAEFEYLRAHDRVNAVEAELGRRLARVWREMGDMKTYTQDLGRRDYDTARRDRASVWLWRTRDVLASDDTLDAAIATLRGMKARRVYAYLYSDGQLLNDRKDRERFTQFVELCAQWDIEVWALLGEPEWISGGDTAAVARALDNVKLFNAGFSRYEPKIAGVKLDLEPHSIAGWEDGGETRAKLESAWFALLETAKGRTGDELPLWVDLPVKFFRPEEKALLDRVAETVSGATMMDYFDAENPIVSWAESALRAYDGPLEIGLELSASAPKTDTLAAKSPDEIAALIGGLNETLAAHESFAGLALHDYMALTQR